MIETDGYCKVRLNGTWLGEKEEVKKTHDGQCVTDMDTGCGWGLSESISCLQNAKLAESLRIG